MSDDLEGDPDDMLDEDQDELDYDDCVHCGGWGYHTETGKKCGWCEGTGRVRRD